MAYVAECRYSAPDDQWLKALTAMLRSEGKHVIERIGVLQWDLNGIAASLHLTQQETMDYFTDGRRVSFILERRICRDIIGGRLSPSEGAGFDLIDAHGRKWEVRSITGGGIYFCPSYMVGSGRSFDEGSFFAKLDEIEGYVVSDVTKFP